MSEPNAHEVLYIEDGQTARVKPTRAMEALGCIIHQVDSVESGIQILAQNPGIRIIVSMAGYDGSDATKLMKHVHEQHLDVSIVFLTALEPAKWQEIVNANWESTSSRIHRIYKGADINVFAETMTTLLTQPLAPIKTAGVVESLKYIA